ncbi:unnamed protein product [Dicrocoelium dendriticum]|nr:unnamed protein product [Dicrocoelium dendriticum]
MLPQNDACLLLKSRAWHHWLSGLFMDCTCTSIRQQEAVPSYILRVTMNETKFPQDYHALEFFEAEWHINRLLNEEAGDCYSTVTLINELNNSPILGEFDTNKDFILTGLAYPSVCSSLLKFRKFVDQKVSIKRCSRIRNGAERGHLWKRIRQYKLTLHQKFSSESNPLDYSLMFVDELNHEECDYNGYWATKQE